jgi:hypothetical protein
MRRIRSPIKVLAVALCATLAFVALAPAVPALDTGPPAALELASHPADLSPATVAPIDAAVEAFAPNCYALPFHQPARYESASSAVGRRIGHALSLDYYNARPSAVRYPLLS